MDDAIRLVQMLWDKAAAFPGFEGYKDSEWLWVSLISCVLLIFYFFVRYVISRRKLKNPEVEPSARTVGDLQRAGSAGELSDQPLTSQGVAVETEEPEREVSLGSGAGDVHLQEPIEGGVAVLPVLEEEPEERFFERLKGRLARTQDQFIGRIDQVLSRKKSVDQDMLEELEEVLVTADLGVKTSYQLLGELQKKINDRSLTPGALREFLKEKIRSLLMVEPSPFEPGGTKPFVIMVVGVNGVGKTTTVGKLGARLRDGDRKVMMVAADTFRPAAIEQLNVWSQRIGADFVKHGPGADPSAVVYDAMHAAVSRGTDIVMVDTAGRLHTKTNLMEELKKVKRVIGREVEGAPHEILLVLDATTGQNAITQARVFHEALNVTGLVLTKLDGTAKGGVIVGISHELLLPVRFIGIGEQVDDLREFNPHLFLEAIFGVDSEFSVH